MGSSTNLEVMSVLSGDVVLINEYYPLLLIITQYYRLLPIITDYYLLIPFVLPYNIAGIFLFSAENGQKIFKANSSMNSPLSCSEYKKGVASMKYNPFRPGSVIHPGMFSGRVHEIDMIKKCLFQTKHGNPQNFLIQGERGIGKSSLVLYTKQYLSTQKNDNYNFLVIKVDLAPKYSFLDIVEKLIAETEIECKRLGLSEPLVSALNLLKKVQSSYISIKESRTPPYMLISNIAELFKKISEKKELDGVCILIDEADKPSAESDLGSFFKLFTERLVTIDCNKICLGISGLPETLDKLRLSHESSLRIFHILNLKPLLPKDRETVIDLGLSEANKKGETKVSIADSSKKLITQLSEGYPYFLQQFCYSAFEADQDNTIDNADVEKGIYSPDTGALKQLGEKLFNNLFYDRIDSTEYRKVLQYMAAKQQEQDKQWVPRADIIKHSGIKLSTVNNALQALKDRQIIFDNPNKKGEYKLPSRSFAIWINIFTKNGQSHILQKEKT